MQASIKAGTWTESDKEKITELLNFIAKEAKFDSMTVDKTIKLYGMLSWVQKDLLPKIGASILEVVAVKDIPAEPEPKTKSKSKGKSK